MKQKMNTYLFGASMVALTFSLNITNVNAASTCAAMPTCAEMGYTEYACGNGAEAIKCPFDTTKMKCVSGCDKNLYPLSSCDTTYGTCAQCGDKYRYTSCINDAKLNPTTNMCERFSIGDIYYAAYVPVGVVVYTTETETVIMSLHNVGRDATDQPGKTMSSAYVETDNWMIPWCDDNNTYVCGPSGLPTSNDCTLDDLDMNGYSNSQFLKSTSNMAGWVAANYKPKGCSNYTSHYTACTKGNWYLPGSGELWLLEMNFDKVNEGLQKINGTKMDDYDYFWSSTASGSSNSCSVTVHPVQYQATIQYEGNALSNLVRPFIRIPK